MKHRKGDMIPLLNAKFAQVEEVLLGNRYKVILPNVRELDDGYTTNVAIVELIERYVIKEYI